MSKSPAPQAPAKLPTPEVVVEAPTPEVVVEAPAPEAPVVDAHPPAKAKPAPAPEPPPKPTGPYKWRARKSAQFAPGMSPGPAGMRRGPALIAMTRAGVFYDYYDEANDWMGDFPEFFEKFDTTPTRGGTVPRKPREV